VDVIVVLEVDEVAVVAVDAVAVSEVDAVAVSEMDAVAGLAVVAVVVLAVVAVVVLEVEAVLTSTPRLPDIHVLFGGRKRSSEPSSDGCRTGAAGGGAELERVWVVDSDMLAAPAFRSWRRGQTNGRYGPNPLTFDEAVPGQRGWEREPIT
jgi:hypothetical protein